MKKVRTWAVSMLLAVVMALSLPVSAMPALASGSLPTEATECGTSGFSPEFLCIAFEEDEDWLNSMTTVTVNGTAYTHKKTIGYFESVSKAWTVGSYMGSYGSYPALKITTDGMSYPVTIIVSAEGYPEATITVTRQGYYNYVAEIKENKTEPTTYAVSVDDSIEHGSVTVDMESAEEGDTVTITVTLDENYEIDEITVTDADGGSVGVTDDHTFTMPASDVMVSATFKQQEAPEPTPDPDPGEKRTIKAEQITVDDDMFGQTWYFNVSGDNDYVGAITGIQVNGTAWESYDYSVSSGGKYRLNASENRIELAEMNFSSSGPDVIKSGDIITITADGYNELTLKFIVDSKTGDVYVTEDDGKGDPYELHVRIEGAFDSAITGQEYDAISGATTGVSLSKNSSVTVYGALVEKGTEPSDDDWKELDTWTSGESGIDLDSSRCHAYVIPDTDKGTTEDKDSGLSGVYLVISSDLTLSGTARDPGDYLVYVEIADEQGRTATSNKIPVRVYSGEETLADKMDTANMTQTQDGKYMWDQEPWAIKNFGSNVEGENESVRVLSGLKAWYGSHTSGTYGFLGYDLAWKQVEDGNIPQTLYIPSGCDLTLVNMKILSSVRIVIEDGGKLTLRDSVVQGIIDVEKGGTFSMNYDSYSGEFLTGASVCGQVRLQDGAILENAAIYSHANYVANGDRTDRTTTNAVVTATGNVTVKGDVYIEGDDAGYDCGQTGLLVKDGTVNIEEGGTLVVIGGEGMLGWDGGTAVKLNNGTITGNGKLVALGGTSDAIQGVGGDAITGNGAVSTEETFLRGGTAYTGHEPGKAVSGDKVKVDSDSTSIEDGVEKNIYGDPYKNLYWETGIKPQPPLELYVVDPAARYTVSVADAENGKASVSAAKAREGAVITVTTTPDQGYVLDSLVVTDANGDVLAVTDGTFIMPASNVTVTAVFRADSSTDPTEPTDPTDPSDPSKPADPAEPTDPADPSEPIKPADPVNPAGPSTDDKDGANDTGSSGHKSSSHHKHSSDSANTSGSTNTAQTSAVVSAGNTTVQTAANELAAVTTDNAAVNGTGAAADVTTTDAAESTPDNAANGHVNATGDDAHMTLWLTIMAISMAALVMVRGRGCWNRYGR